ncbi:MAG: rhomboid family intramembrane serine protease [Chitinophagaceae bacterium]
MSFSVLILIITNFIFSYRGFTNTAFFDGYKFEVDKILINKDYKRLITSGFLHVSWTHLIFNMFSLYFFSGLEYTVGPLNFLIIYFSSLIGGDLLSLFIHRHHGEYSAVGASGAVCGIIFASIALHPGSSIRFFGLPFDISSWLYGLLYILYSIYGIRSSKDNIGHDAHLGGALIGMLVSLLIRPSAFSENYVTILIIAVPAIVFIYMIIAAPQILLVNNLFFNNRLENYTLDQRYNIQRSIQQSEVDRILDKISKRGMASLTKKRKTY